MLIKAFGQRWFTIASRNQAISTKIPCLPKTSPQRLPEIIDPAALELPTPGFQKDLFLESERSVFA
jgi:hypothetical protein